MAWVAGISLFLLILAMGDLYKLKNDVDCLRDEVQMAREEISRNQDFVLGLLMTIRAQTEPPTEREYSPYE